MTLWFKNERGITMKSFKKVLVSYLFFGLSALGISMGIVANIGVSSYNSMNLSIAYLSTVEVGTVSIAVNLVFLSMYIILTKCHYKRKYCIQAVSVLVFGVMINDFTYHLQAIIVNMHYWQRLLLLVAGTSLSAFAIGGIIHYNVITFPVESACLEISALTPFSFMTLRYSIDILSILVSLGLSITCELPIFVREGTILSMLLLSFLINRSKLYFSSRFKHMHDEVAITQT